MTQPDGLQRDVSLEDSIPEAAAPLESILCTEELQRRPSRPPDYEKENSSLVKLVSALADSPNTVLQTLAETILHITQCDSAGLSLLTRDGKTPDVCGQRFYWPAIAGMWKPHIGKGTPRKFGPCGDVLDQNRTLLFKHFERRYPYFEPVTPVIEECLLVPFYVSGEAVGTIWAIMHSERRKFDAEDDRVMASLGKFASSAYQALVHIDELKIQVAEREKAEAEVRELACGLEAKIRRLVEANVVGIVIWTLEGAIIEANDAFLHIVRYGREDLVLGRVRWTDLTPPEWCGHDTQALTDLRAIGVFQPFEKEYLRKDGSRVPVLVGGALFEKGGSQGIAFVLDLSEQKRAEEALRRSEAYLAEAQKLSSTGSWHWNISTGEVTWSQEFFTILGFDSERDNASHQLYAERIHPQDRSKVEEALATAIRERQDFDIEYRLLLPGGLIKYLHSIGRCLVNKPGGVEYIGAVIDITDRKRAEEEREKLRQLEADLAHVTRVSTMGELTASLAHEIKQPIGAAVTNAQACLRFIDRHEPDLLGAREAAVEMIKDARRAADIIEHVRSLFRKGSSSREIVDLNEVVLGMVAMLQKEADRQSVRISADLTNELIEVMADRVQLQQVLMNLMLNGIEAMRDMNGELNIKSQLGEDGQALITVSDTGVGLPAENADRVFNAFFTTKSQGTGLGLAITRSIIESHGGRVWAASNPGPGATFQFTLPIRETAGK